jgi:hypothetical protein
MVGKTSKERWQAWIEIVLNKAWCCEVTHRKRERALNCEGPTGMTDSKSRLMR